MGAIKIVKKKKKLRKDHQMIQESLFPSDLEQPKTDKDLIEATQKQSGLGVLMILGIVLCFAGIGLIWGLANSGDKEQAYAFVELKSLDIDGHPIAGAYVFKDKENLGATDSFGEWRRFLKVTEGETLSFLIKKQSLGLTASKSFVVPQNKQKGQDMELSSTLTLVPKVEKLSSGVPERRALKDSRRQPTLSKNKKGGNQLERFLEDSFNTLDISLGDVEERYFNEQDAKSAKSLNGLVMPQLKKYSKKIGIELTKASQWKVELSHLPRSASNTSNGVILVRLFQNEGEKPIEFLKNYLGNPLVTAKKILWGVKQHTAKKYKVTKHKGRWVVLEAAGQSSLWDLHAGDYLASITGKRYQVSSRKIKLGNNLNGVPLVVMDRAPCSKKQTVCDLYSSHVGIAPPGDGWETLKVQIYGMKADDKLFVRGYLANYEGGKVWSYWGQRDTPVNATIVRQGLVHVRKKIVNKKNKIPLLNIPDTNYSKSSSPKWVR